MYISESVYYLDFSYFKANTDSPIQHDYNK